MPGVGSDIATGCTIRLIPIDSGSPLSLSLNLIRNTGSGDNESDQHGIMQFIAPTQDTLIF